MHNQRVKRLAQPRASGFTSVELLVVIGVVALLCALLAPALSGAKRRVRATGCRQNVRQLMLALRMYTDDTGCFPLFADVTGGGWELWTKSLAPFLGARLIRDSTSEGGCSCFTCPAVGKGDLRAFPEGISYGYVDRGYAFQGLGEKVLFDGSATETLAVHESEVRNPAETLGIADGIVRLKCGLLLHSGISLERWRRYLPLPVEDSGGLSVRDLIDRDRRVRVLHSGQVQAGYCDGHVQGSKLSFLFDDLSDTALRQWNRDNQPHLDWLQP